jgi:RNA polymerase sigma-70 factor (ECF subfamily)
VDRTRWEGDLSACYDRVLRGLAAVSGSLTLAEDALQDALVAALKPGVIDSMQRVDAWLYVTALRALKRTRWRRRVELSLGKLALVAPPPNEDRLEVLSLLGALSDRQRQVIVARHYLRMNYAEIAQTLGINVGTATSTATQALQKMRSELTKSEVPKWKRAN